MDSRRALEVNGRQSRTVRLTVSPEADFREVIRTIHAIVIPPVRVSAEHLRFAVLELLNNSVRAHREKGEARSISVDMTVAEAGMVVAIRDFGGGFDPQRLPYDLDADPATLDLHSPAFEGVPEAQRVQAVRDGHLRRKEDLR
jgi:hypothetical protein